MGLFNRNYNKPGPGISKDEPPKKGVKRFFQLLSEDGSDLLKLNLIFCICIIPSALVFLLWLFGFLGALAFALSFVLALPVGGAMTACHYCIAKMLREEPGYVWHDFKRKFKENFKQSLMPGLMYIAFIYAQIYQFYLISLELIAVDAFLLITVMLVPLIFGMITPYIFLQIAHINLKITQIFTNSVLMFLKNLPRSLMGALTGGIVYIAFMLFFPASIALPPFTIILILYGFTIPWLLCLMWVWPVTDKAFSITERLNAESEDKDS